MGQFSNWRDILHQIKIIKVFTKYWNSLDNKKCGTVQGTDISELKKCFFHYHHFPEVVLVLISIRTMIICLLFAKVHCNFDSQPIQRLEQVTILLNGYSCSMYREMLYEVHTCWKPEKTQCLPNWLQPLYLMRERALSQGKHFWKLLLLVLCVCLIAASNWHCYWK